MTLPLPSTAICGVAPYGDRLKLFYQYIGGAVDESKFFGGVWSPEKPVFSTVPLSPLASIIWNGEGSKELRVYYLDKDYIIQEYCHSSQRGWYPGEIGKLKVKANPLSRLGALVYFDLELRHCRVYYQEQGTNAIVELCHDGDKWQAGELRINDALEGTGIAAVSYGGDEFLQIRVYYQTSKDSYMKEYCHNNKGWFPGQFAPGKGSFRTPISAVAVSDHKIQVFWRDHDGQLAHAKHTGRWNPPTVIKEVGPGFKQLAVLTWDGGEHLRLFYQAYEDFLIEVSSDNGGETWGPGKNISGTN